MDRRQFVGYCAMLALAALTWDAVVNGGHPSEAVADEGEETEPP